VRPQRRVWATGKVEANLAATRQSHSAVTRQWHRAGMSRGRAVQVDPVRPMLKAPGSVHLTLRYDGPVSNFAYNFILRRYSMVVRRGGVRLDSVGRRTGGSAAPGRRVRPTRFNLEIRSTGLLNFGRLRTSRIDFWVILPIRCSLVWVQGVS